jgi:hypothetical protein
VSDWVCGRCKSINRERAATCYSCGGIRGAMQLQPNTMIGGPATAAAPTSAASGVGVGTGAAALSGAAAAAGEMGGMPVADVVMPEPKPALPAGPANLLGGVLGGAIGAVLATGLWYGVVAVTNWQVGIVAIAVGFVVGQGVLFGAAGRGSILLVPVSVAFTLLALVVSEYLIVYNFVVQEFGSAGMIDIVQPPDFVIEIVMESVTADPLTLVFWAIAGYQAVMIPMRSVAR